MVSQINMVLKQSLQTFMSKSLASEAFLSNFQQLKTIVDNLTAEHVNLDPIYKKTETWNDPRKAPMTYIEIYKDEFINMAIFILKPGSTLPLHDHPQMHGLLKVISGTVKIESYSLRSDLLPTTDEKNLSENSNSSSSNDTNVSETSFSGSDDPSWMPLRPEFVAERNDDVIVTNLSESCVLEPTKNNFHEIVSIDGPSAFLDVLAPPYDTDIPIFGPRRCGYYEVVREITPKIYVLAEIPPPDWFWSDVAPYSGPEIINS